MESNKKNMRALLIITVILIPFYITSAIYAEEGNEILIGGWGFAENKYAKKNKINYARVVYSPSKKIAEKICSKQFIVTVNLRGFRKEGEIDKADAYISDVKAWANLANKYSCIVELAQDDFRGWWNKKYKKNKNIILTVVENIKKINPNLMFGATIYEDDLDKLSSEELSFLGNNIDVIHFYLHKRYRISGYDKYINRLKKYFPSAKIILGIYRYDRREYEKRSKGSQEELDLFTKQLEYSLDMVKRKKVNGIEFYPGRLGADLDVIKRKKIVRKSEGMFKIMSQKIRGQLILLDQEENIF